MEISVEKKDDVVTDTTKSTIVEPTVKAPSMASKDNDVSGETIVNKMNREKAYLDRELLFQDLYENFLICVQRNEPRVKPKSNLILNWDFRSTFEEFLSDSVENIDRQIESIKFAKDVNAQKISATEGNFFLQEAKIDAGSASVEQKFGIEDHEATHEILRKTREIIQGYLTGKIQMIINTETGRIRLVGNK